MLIPHRLDLLRRKWDDREQPVLLADRRQIDPADFASCGQPLADLAQRQRGS
jgi:hypothetical protein